MSLNGFCKELGISTVLVTNGVRFGDDKYWNQYKECPNDNIGLSIKAGSQEQFADVAGSRRFSTMKKGVTRALQLDGGLSITYNSFYKESLIDLAKFAVDCGAKSVKIDFCSTTIKDGKPDGTYMIPPKELAEKIMRDYPELDRITGGNIIFEMMVPFCLFQPEFIKELIAKKQMLSVCQMHHRAGIIFDEIGQLLMCNALFDYPIGVFGKDFKDGASMLEFLDNPEIIGCYKGIGCYPSVDCQSCGWYSQCAGGCPLRWALYKPEDIIRPYIAQ